MHKMAQKEKLTFWRFGKSNLGFPCSLKTNSSKASVLQDESVKVNDFSSVMGSTRKPGNTSPGIRSKYWFTQHLPHSLAFSFSFSSFSSRRKWGRTARIWSSCTAWVCGSGRVSRTKLTGSSWGLHFDLRLRLHPWVSSSLLSIWSGLSLSQNLEKNIGFKWMALPLYWIDLPECKVFARKLSPFPASFHGNWRLRHRMRKMQGCFCRMKCKQRDCVSYLESCCQEWIQRVLRRTCSSSTGLSESGPPPENLHANRNLRMKVFVSFLPFFRIR